jgi:hypothetical protein
MIYENKAAWRQTTEPTTTLQPNDQEDCFNFFKQVLYFSPFHISNRDKNKNGALNERTELCDTA